MAVVVGVATVGVAVADVEVADLMALEGRPDRKGSLELTTVVAVSRRPGAPSRTGVPVVVAEEPNAHEDPTSRSWPDVPVVVVGNGRGKPDVPVEAGRPGRGRWTRLPKDWTSRVCGRTCRSRSLATVADVESRTSRLRPDVPVAVAGRGLPKDWTSRLRPGVQVAVAEEPNAHEDPTSRSWPDVPVVVVGNGRGRWKRSRS